MTDLAYALDRLDSFHQLERNWDGYNGFPISTAVIDNAELFVRRLHRVGVTEGWAVFPMSDGGVEFEWDDDTVNAGMAIQFEDTGDLGVLLCPTASDTKTWQEWDVESPHADAALRYLRRWLVCRSRGLDPSPLPDNLAANIAVRLDNA